MGFATEFLVALYTRFIILQWAGLACVTGMIIDLLSYGALATALLTKKYPEMVAFILGRTFGTYLGTKTELKSDKLK